MKSEGAVTLTFQRVGTVEVIDNVTGRGVVHRWKISLRFPHKRSLYSMLMSR